MSEERTHDATAKALRDARRRGDVWRSRELGTALAMLAAAAVLGLTGEALLDAHTSVFTLALDAAAGRVGATPGAILEASVATAARAIAPLLVVLVLAAVLASFLQIGPLFAPEALAWRIERLDPRSGMRRLADRDRLVELARVALLLVIVTAIAIATLGEGWRGLAALSARSPEAALRAGGVVLQSFLARAGGAVLAVAILDVLYQRWRWHRAHRMTRREVERERRESDGDPQLQRARERLRHELAERSDLERAADADVLVVGAKIAVALRFERDRDDAVPEIVARGEGGLAARLTEAAHQAEVPVRADAALAAALAAIPRGAAIPRAQYAAVAAVLRDAWAERERG